MQIRKATIKDAEALLALYEDLGYPTTASKLSRRLEMILLNEMLHISFIRQLDLKK